MAGSSLLEWTAHCIDIALQSMAMQPYTLAFQSDKRLLEACRGFTKMTRTFSCMRCPVVLHCGNLANLSGQNYSAVLLIPLSTKRALNVHEEDMPSSCLQFTN
jgi:hypothetical protein